jgi:hypothetical protein
MNDSKEVKSNVTRMPPNAGKGRKAGVPNKVAANVKSMILGALDDLGGQTWIVEQAKADPKAFLSLLARILPSEVALDATVTAHEPITRIIRTIVDPRATIEEVKP